MQRALKLGRRIRNKIVGSPDVYPQAIELTGVVSTPLRFRVYSPVERFRVAEFGGERETLMRFLSELEPTDVVFDIGASVGLFTVSTASVVTQGKVFAFEPDPETGARLDENLQLNGLDNVELVAWAVGASEGELSLYTDGAKGFAPSLARQAHQGAPSHAIKVAVHPLDGVLAEDGLLLPTVLKVDIEGAEALWIQGSARLLRGEFGPRPRVLFLELHPEFLPAFGSSAAEIRSVVADSGYTLVWEQHRADQLHLCYHSESG